MRKFLCAVWSVETAPHMDKEETFFLKNCTLVWSNFFIGNPFHETWKFKSKPENLATKFPKRKGIDSCLVEMIYTSFDS